MKRLFIYTVIVGLCSLYAVDLGLDIYIKYKALFSNPNPETGIENITNLEVIDDI